MLAVLTLQRLVFRWRSQRRTKLEDHNRPAQQRDQGGAATSPPHGNEGGKEGPGGRSVHHKRADDIQRPDEDQDAIAYIDPMLDRLEPCVFLANAARRNRKKQDCEKDGTNAEEVFQIPDYRPLR